MNSLTTNQIKEIIATALKNLGIDFKPEEISLEHPTEEKYGDYSTNVALKVFKTFNELKTQNSKLKNTSNNSKLNVIKNPNDLAKKITDEINSLIHNTKYLPLRSSDEGGAKGGIILESVSAVPPGFINFKLSQDFLTEELKVILKDQLRYGLNQSLKDKKIMLEFAQPNTHKMFHIGHLRNITTGEAIVRILEANGAKVTRANYQGDVGLHIAKCLYGIFQDYYSRHPEVKPKDLSGNQGILRSAQNDVLKELRLKYKTIDEKMTFLGKVYAEGSKAYEEEDVKSPTATTSQAKKEINALNTKIYNKDPLIYSLYQETRQWSLDYFNKIYKRVDSKFDRFYFESETFELGRKIVLDNVGKVFEKSQGAIIFDGEKHGLHKRVFINSDGNPTYEAKDMGLGSLKLKEYNPDICINIVGPEQTSYFQVIFEALAQLIPESRGRFRHLPYGWVKLKNGKMSSRLGNVVLGEWLIDELKKKLTGILTSTRHPEEQSDEGSHRDSSAAPQNDDDFNEMIEAAAIAAAKYSFLKVGTAQEIAFDIDESVNLQGDSGPYIQYTYARTQSVLAKIPNSTSHSGLDPESIKIDSSFRWNDNMNPEELAVLRLLYKFPEVVLAAGKSYSPCIICEYLFDLCQKFNGFYNKHRILNADSEDLINQRLAITGAVGIILKNGLTLLGIKSPSKM